MLAGIGIGVESDKFSWNRNEKIKKCWNRNLNQDVPGIMHHCYQYNVSSLYFRLLGSYLIHKVDPPPPMMTNAVQFVWNLFEMTMNQFW